MKMNNTDSISDATRKTILIYGPSGSGKTVFASTAPSPVFIDTDEGMLSLKGKSIPYYTFSDDGPALGWTNIIKTIQKISSDTTVNTIVIDSITTISNVAMDYVQIINKTYGKNPTMQDWGHQISKLKDLISSLKDTDKNIICIAHERFDKDEITGRIWCGPLVTGKFAQQISLYFDEVYHSEVTGTTPPKYSLLMRSSSLYVAKSRISGDPSTLYYKPIFNSLGEKHG